MDLSKMSDGDLVRGIKGQLIVYEDIDGPLVSKDEMADELARRLAAEKAAKDAVCDAMRRQAIRLAALTKAAEKVIEMNRQHAEDQYGDADKAESWSCVTVLREALAAQHPNGGSDE